MCSEWAKAACANKQAATSRLTHTACRPARRHQHHPHARMTQNELAVVELIHCFVEVLDKHFGQVCELDIMNDPDVVSC